MEENFILKLRSNDKVRFIIAGIIWLVHLYGVVQMFFNDDFLEIFNRLRLYTNISNILIFVVVTLYLTGYKDKNWFKYFAVIGLVAILMTGIIFHTLVSDGDVNFDGHIVHTINPILYPIFYFLLVTPGIRLRHFWVSLILPTVYFTVILSLGPWTHWYPYGFMDPTKSSLLQVIGLCIGLLLPVIAIFTLGLLALKKWMEKAVNKA